MTIGRLTICFVLLTVVHAPAIQSPVVARVELEKTRFLQGERIFLWISAQRSASDDRPIPPALLHSQRVIYTRPDGTTRVDQPSAPLDGMGANTPGDFGFRGGWSLRDDPPQLGRWSVVYELGAIRSAPAVFTIEAPDALKKVDARLEFSTPFAYSPAAKLTLVVSNGSPAVLRFIALGQNHSIVWGRLRGGGFESSFFIPPDVLERATGQKRPGVSVDPIDWDSIKLFSVVTVRPGETWRVSVPLAPWMGEEFGRAGTELSFSTELQMLVGEKGGEWSDFSPLRLEARGMTKIN